MTVRVGVNGFGRIGRNFWRAVDAQRRRGRRTSRSSAVNDITDNKTLAHLLKYDSILGRLPYDVSSTDEDIVVDGKGFKGLAVRDPATLPWKDLGVDVVIESTGIFTKREAAAKHLEAGAKKVIISAPATGEDITVVMGVNDDEYDGAQDVDLERVVHDELPGAVGEGARRPGGDRAGADDHDPRLHAGSEPAGRAAQGSAAGAGGGVEHGADVDGCGEGDRVGVAAAEGQAGRLSRCGCRCPTGSATDLTCERGSEVSVEEINAAYRAAADGPLEGLSGVRRCADRVQRHRDRPGVVHLRLGADQGDRGLVKVVGWYDNEWGYSNRLVDLTGLVASKL